ncbi:unnamed protein product [Orchesella dallaii]|uniref:Reverse transcriptase domain-containing protein n=1 Tax=Orchesella dallaii TaxID=48710 RepID=A0ABP1QC81_9HEXA
MEQNRKLPNFLNDYESIVSHATRDNQYGRRKGGLMLLYRKAQFSLEQVLEIHNNWILCRLKGLYGQSIVIACVYIPPQPMYNQLVNEFMDSLDLHTGDVCSPLIIGGDFNARLGNKNRIPDELNENTFLLAERKSYDTTINSRGKILRKLFENQGLTILNGRTLSDPNGEFTYTSRIGSSFVDHIWVPLYMNQLIYDFAVEEFSASDHQPISALMHWISDQNSKTNKQKPNYVQKFRWIPEKAAEFKDYLSDLPVPDMKVNKPSDLYQRISSAIKDAADVTDMGYANQFLADYLTKQKSYETTVAGKKKTHYENIRDSLSTSADPKDFWNTISRLRGSERRVCPISKTNWEMFYQSVLPAGQADDTDYFGVAHPTLDAEININEIIAARRKLKLKKSPGLDGIRNEFLKSLPLSWLNVIKDLFNQIQSSENIPEDIIHIEVVMLFKKGDPADPRNYRGISLINTILKLFTSIMLARLEEWAEANELLPESQAGFRKKRGCTDHIFTLEAVRQISWRRMKKRKLHLLFVDFARAFDSINHKKLWSRLNAVGVSGKFIRIFRDMYSKATMRVRTLEGPSKRFEVAEGVLQGELTSPLLFALYIRDIDDIFKMMSGANGQAVRGISINHQREIHVLAYADDLVILADCPSQLQLKLNRLSQYCEEKELTVNVSRQKF